MKGFYFNTFLVIFEALAWKLNFISLGEMTLLILVNIFFLIGEFIRIFLDFRRDFLYISIHGVDHLKTLTEEPQNEYPKQ